MHHNPNWLKIAVAAEQGDENSQQSSNTSLKGAPPVPQETGLSDKVESASKPPLTPTTTQKSQQDKNARTENRINPKTSVMDAANKALPTLNQSLYTLTNELMSRDDIRLSENTARGLAIEIMAAWLAASRKSTVSNLAVFVGQSSRIESVLASIS